ncbi:beta-3-deoxy-D-manno-oct-2-ulosonic acid transferase [Sphingomonas solaris]|uniref:capsular polysaccharide export protein, LipB/KpsS family n=1 Tax=Alterirhizorhabdus solaris TaxID=2529389 RepID=UPI0030B81F92
MSRIAPGFVASGDQASTLVAAIRTARVGGPFWAPATVVAADVVVVCPVTRDEALALPSRRGDEPMLALLPDTPWAAEAVVLLGIGHVAAGIGEVDVWPLLDKAALVEAAGDDELILLALIAGIPARATTPGRFTGHGLTEGEAPPVDRAAALVALVATTLCTGVRYRDCFSGTGATPLQAVARLTEWRRLIDANRGVAVAAGIAMWKRREISRLLWNGSTPLRFARSPGRALRLASGAKGAIAAWPSRVPAGLADAATAAGVPLVRVEDGFIRSVGLGSNLHPPLSIVADSRGIYYDPTGPSDLETLLAEVDFPPALIARARALATAIVAAGISKYSSGNAPYRIDSPAGRRRVLVAGQVEDDLSVRLGGGAVAGNLDLLRRARAAEPDAFLLFKPHPDVDAGHRAGRIEDAEALLLADRVVRDVAMPALLDAVDGVHVLTSLAGYEALLRGRDVTVHGSPFYAGWGLTRDLGPTLPRRTRCLSIDELTAAALILYPRYLDPVTGLPCPPETLVQRLAAQAAPRETPLIRLRRLQGWLRRARTPIGRLA